MAFFFFFPFKTWLREAEMANEAEEVKVKTNDLLEQDTFRAMHPVTSGEARMHCIGKESPSVTQT